MNVIDSKKVFVPEDESVDPSVVYATVVVDEESGNDTLNESTPPNVRGEQEVSGHMPDPGSDDDTLANAHAMGLQLDEDEENPKPVDVGRDIERAEKWHRDH